MTFGTHGEWLRWTAMLCIALLVPGEVPLVAQQAVAETEPVEKPKTPDQLDSLVAPIALYPDPLLAQILAASTYPLEIVQCQRWLTANSKLTGESLTKAAASTEGQKDGVYWPGEDSPVAAKFAKAAAEGYPTPNAKPQAYHGYFYKILLAQGPEAVGGAQDYVVHGLMIGGYALVAWPAEYGFPAS